MNNQKILIILIILMVMVGGWFGYKYFVEDLERDWVCIDGEWVNMGVADTPMPDEPCEKEEEAVACAMDVKECPDGSYVSRIPPKCNFAPCPSEKGSVCEDGACLEVELYYYNPELDRDESDNIACSKKGLVAVEREISVSQTPVQDTIKHLLLGELTEAEQLQGIETEFPLEGFSLKGASLENNVLTLEFDDPNNQTVGGSCRVNLLRAQIEETAKQFSGIEEVRFLPEELFQP